MPSPLLVDWACKQFQSINHLINQSINQSISQPKRIRIQQLRRLAAQVPARKPTLSEVFKQKEQQEILTEAAASSRGYFSPTKSASAANIGPAPLGRDDSGCLLIYSQIDGLPGFARKLKKKVIKNDQDTRLRIELSSFRVMCRYSDH